MRGWRTVIWRIRELFTREARCRELDEELHFHLEMESEQLVREGLTPEQARRAARIRLGGVEQVKERYRDRQGFPGVEALGRDVAHAARTLRRHPLYTTAAVLSLALGIGANTAVFSLFDAFVLRPLPYPEAGQLALIHESGRFAGVVRRGAVAPPVLRDWRERSRAFVSIGGFLAGSVNLGAADGATRVPAAFVEPEVFTALGVAPALGRVILSENTTEGGDHVLVLGDALWRDRFGGRTDVVGQTLRIDGADYQVVGVMPPTFEFPPRASAALWLPLPLGEYQDRGLKILSVIARAAPGVSVAAARDDMARVSRELTAVYPNSSVAAVVPLHVETVGRTGLILLVLAAVVAVVLLLACANVAHMVLARANARRHEFAVRLALGASRQRILRLLLAEGALLAAAGAVLGLAMCRAALDALLAWPETPLTPGIPVSISWPVLGYCAVVATASALAVSLVPALRMSGQILQADLAEAIPSSRRRARQGNRLITIEVAAAVVLVIAAGMLGRSLLALTNLDFGFRPDHLLTARLTLPKDTYPDVARIHGIYDRLLERLAQLPGVEAVGLNNLLPVQMSYTNMDFTVEGRADDRPGYAPFAEHRTVSHDFFRAMGIPIIAGRAFTAAENRWNSRVVVVSRRAAATYWPNTDAVGKRLAYGTQPKPDRWLTIVGVAGDIKSAGIGQPPQVILYAPYRDFDYPIRSMSIVMRTTGPPLLATRAVREVVRDLDADLALYWVSTMEEVVDRAAAGTRFLGGLLAGFSSIAILLAIVGVYGVMSYAVSQRHREIGVRLAMGATRIDVLRLVLGLGTRRTLIGIGAGALAAISLNVMLRPFLIGVGPVDPAAHAGAAAVVLGVALLASAIPAYRASRVDPIEALRHE